MWLVAANYRLVWSEGWQPSSAQSAFIKWTRWTPMMAAL